ncbi:MAG: HAD family hydrolase [Eubacteriales bacterium]|nr:HAD family hydrolase [Eubacteriales bacterium]
MNLVFDIDDTIYDLREPFEKAYKKLLAHRTRMSGEELFMKSRVYSDLVLRQEKEGNIRSEDTFYERMRLTCQDAGILLTREEGRQFEAEYRYHQANIQVFSFMKEILDECRKKQVPIAVLTNGSRQGQQKKIDVLSLKDWFDDDRIFISGVTGYQKPDVHAFRYVEEKLHFLPKETWYIGDTYEADIIGASQAGWHTIWMNHRNRPCPEAASRADREITKGEQLLSQLQSLQIL